MPRSWRRGRAYRGLAAAGAVSAGRRGPGMPGSAQTFPGEYASPAAGFATGKPLDVAPGCAVLASFLEEVAGATTGTPARPTMSCWGHQCVGPGGGECQCRKHAAVAELIRRRPAAGRAEGPGGCRRAG